MSALKALADHFREGDWPMWPILAILIVVLGDHHRAHRLSEEGGHR